MLLRTWIRSTKTKQPSKTSSRGRLLDSSSSPTLISLSVRSFWWKQIYMSMSSIYIRFLDYECRISSGFEAVLVLAIHHWDRPPCPPEPSGNPKFRSHKCCPSSVSAAITWVRTALPICVHCQHIPICFEIMFFWGQPPSWQRPHLDIFGLGQLWGN